MRTRHSLRRLGAALVPLLFVAACGGGGSGGTPTEPGEPNPPPPPPQNKPPVVKVDAPEGEVMELATVTLSAKGSSDPDGDKLTFKWTQTAGPTVSELDGAESDTISFKAPRVLVAADLTFTISTTDGNGGRTEKYVTLKIVEAEAVVYLQERTSEPYGHSLWLLHPAIEQPQLISQTEIGGEIVRWSVSSDRQRIAWVQDVGNEEALYLASLHGDPGVTLVRRAPERRIHDLSWAHDGRTLLFTHDATFENERELFRANLSDFGGSADLLRLSPALADEDGNGVPDRALQEFVVSPAGDLVAMEFGDEALVSDLDGNLVRLSSTLTSIKDPRWSRDGKWLAFFAETAAGAPTEVFVADPADADSARSVTGAIVENGQASRGHGLSWSPVSNELAFQAYLREADDRELFVIDADAEDPAGSRVTASGEVAGGAGVRTYGYAWSPDGTRIAFVGTDFENDVLEVFISDITSESVQRTNVTGDRITDGAVYLGTELLWSPDSRHLLFQGDLETDGNIDMYILSTADLGRQTVGLDMRFFCGADRNDFQFSPDSRLFTISCALEELPYGPLFAFSTDSTDGGPINLTGDGFDTNGDGIPDGVASSFAWSPQTDRMIFTGTFSESHNFHELFEVSEDTFGEPQRLLAVQDPQTRIQEFSIIGPHGIVDRR